MLCFALLLATVLPAVPVTSSLETVARGEMSGVEETREAVARTAGEWAAWWREHAGATPAPKVGFGQRMVVAQILTSPGHLVTVPKVTGAIRFEKAGQ